jgi:serine/threonine protein kinase/Tol biopolymer transport system component
MQAERWKQIEELYQAALAQPADKRAAFLAQACPEDAQLRAEVQSLLDQQAESFLESAPVSAIHVLTPGAKLGNFEIVELLGRGGMGEVWRARDARLKRDVAIKVLPVALARDPDRIARFEREARAASALNHPNIVAVHDIGCNNGIYWIASELVRGDTLRRAIEAGPLPTPKAVEIAVQIAAGLAAAHAVGLVHRDLKPDNIMIARGGQVKILDFGLAKQRRTSEESTATDLTDEGVVMGTAGYMAPEQVRGEAADQRADLFSFGVVLYEMLCGKRAFTGDSSVEVMNAILKEEPPELPSSVPAALARIVRRCLEKEVGQRFQSAADLAFALESLSVSPAPAPATKRKDKRKEWMKWAAIAAAALAIVALVYRMGSGAAQPSAGLPDGTFRRLTNDPGLTTSAAISRDGRLVAYASDRADASNLDIWVQQVDGGAPIRLTDDPADDDDPTFSPDGTQIAFRSERDGGGIYIVRALGGEAHLFAPRGRHPRFSPDGRMLMYATAYSGRGDGYELTAAEFPGGASRPVAPGCEVYSPYAVWSPDSSRILFTGNCGTKDDVFISTPGGKPVPSKVEFHNFDEWLPNPSRVLFPMQAKENFSIGMAAISDNGTRAEGPVQRLTFGTGTERHVSAAADGRMVFSSIDTNEHIWGISIDANGRATEAPRQLTSGWMERFPALSKDGRGLAFMSNSAGKFVLYYRDLESGRQREVVRENAFDAPGVPHFSRDGLKMIFGRPVSASADAMGFYEMPVSGGIPEKVSGQDKGWKSIWDWSPDGAAVLFYQQAGGFGRIYEMDLGSHTETSFLDEPDYEVWQARFSSDGRWVAFNGVKSEISRIFAVPFRRGRVQRSEWIALTDGPWDDKPNFATDDSTIFFASKRDGYLCIWGQRLGPDMHLFGSPFAVYHSHQRRRAPASLDLFQMAVGPRMIAFNQAELTGNVWLLEPAKRDGH